MHILKRLNCFVPLYVRRGIVSEGKYLLFMSEKLLSSKESGFSGSFSRNIHTGFIFLTHMKIERFLILPISNLCL